MKFWSPQLILCRARKVPRAACEGKGRTEPVNRASSLSHSTPSVPWRSRSSAVWSFSSGLLHCQIFTSWDSTIFASVFLIRRAVSLEAGLWAQHSDISFSTARRHSSLFHLLDTIGRKRLTHTTSRISSYDGSLGTML